MATFTSSISQIYVAEKSRTQWEPNGCWQPRKPRGCWLSFRRWDDLGLHPDLQLSGRQRGMVYYDVPVCTPGTLTLTKRGQEHQLTHLRRHM